MRRDKVDHYLKAMNARNGKAEATRMILGLMLTPSDKDEMLTCSRIAAAKIGEIK